MIGVLLRYLIVLKVLLVLTLLYSQPCVYSTLVNPKVPDEGCLSKGVRGVCQRCDVTVCLAV